MPNSTNDEEDMRRRSMNIEDRPSTGGRPMNRRGVQEEEIDRDEIAAAPNAGANSGGTRSPKILEKNRKIRRAA